MCSLRTIFGSLVFVFIAALCSAQESPSQNHHRSIPLPTSKMLSAPSPGRIGETNSFPATIVISPDGRYAAMLNDGYGTQETLAHQSIAVLDLKADRITDYPDPRLSDESHQSFFLGLVFSSDGKHLYASVGSITDPTGEKKGDTGNGIAVYTFSDSKVSAERFIPIAPQPLDTSKKVAVGLFEYSSPHRYPVSCGTRSSFGWWAGQAPGCKQSFRQRRVARSSNRQNPAELRSEHE